MVKRYIANIGCEVDDSGIEVDSWPEMNIHPEGEYVDFSDYEKARDALEKALNEWQNWSLIAGRDTRFYGAAKDTKTEIEALRKEFLE